MRTIVKWFGRLGLGVLTIGVIFVLGMRAKSPLVLTPVRRFNRAVFNPQQMKSAGTEGAYASVVRHRGRTSGRRYETPVRAVPTEDGFVIVLPYGTQADWVKNVLASGSAEIVDDGHTHRVDRPDVLPVQAAAAYLTASDLPSLRLFGVDECLRLRRAEAA